jgi:hypothetical protein
MTPSVTLIPDDMITSDMSETLEVSSANHSLILQECDKLEAYFITMAKKIVPTTTYEMAMFETLICEAWKAEMLNCYEVLKGKTSEVMIHDLLNAERDSYIEYIECKAEIEVFYYSGVFDGYGIFLGSLSSVDRVCLLSDGYKQKTIELMEHLEDIGDVPTFIFDRDEYDAKLKEEFYEAYPNAFK